MKQVKKPIEAYFLGWMYSDGCVYSNLKKYVYQSKIKLQDGDSERYVLNLFKEEFKMSSLTELHKNGKLYIGAYKSSKSFYYNLINLGVLPRKSFENKNKLTIPLLSDDLFGYFLRGLFEGDGTFYLRGKTGDRITLFSSSKVFLEGIQTRLRYINIESTLVDRKNTSIICLNINKLESVKCLIDYMYRDNLNMVLSRKYEKTKSFLNFYKESYDRNNLRKAKISQANKGKIRTDEIKKKLSISYWNRRNKQLSNT